MNRTFADIDGAVLVAIVVAVLAIVAVTLVQANIEGLIPACAEDVVLVGAGDFAEGRYERYVCGPALDDFR